ncbi:MAG TPA: ABC transporter permease [Bryobacteraceae bacterium]|nr:ABC transporter permease [Bryobacteraceae bacterium]
MTIWRRFKYLLPAWRRREEREMRQELESLTAIAGAKELGNLTLAMEDIRAGWGWTWFESLYADIRYSLRALRKQPAFVAVAVLSLALAIGANSAIFSFADALLLRPMPVTDPAAMFDVTSTTPDNPFEGMSFPDYRDLRDKSRSFSGLAAYRLTTLAVAANPAAPAQIRFANLVSGNFFAVAGVTPSAGRDFLPGEASASAQPVAVVSYAFWQRNYAGERSAIGSQLRLNGIVFTVVGVAPASFTGLDRFALPSIFVPLGMAQRLDGETADPLEDRGRHNLVVKGRLSAGASRESAQAETAIIGAALEREYVRTNRNRHMAVRTELQTRIQQSPHLLALVKMLMGLVALILIIGCSNVANLLLARGRTRSREIAIRLSIGAGRSRVVRQLMTESLIVAMAGAAAGLFVAYGGILLLNMQSVPSDPPFVLGVRLDWRVVQFSLLAALGSCIFFGLAPAWQTARTDFVGALKTGGDGASGTRRTFGRDVLVAGQVALAMVVLIAAGMFLASFRNIMAEPPEFRTDHLIGMDTAPAALHYSPEQTQAFYRRLVDRVRTMAGVARVAMTESLPLSPSQTAVNVAPEGYQFPKGREKQIEFGAAVDAAYFSTMHVEIERGRAFTDDDRAGSRRVAIVNQQFAKTYWPGQDAIGKRIRVESMDGMESPAAEVVGVAKTGHYLTVNEKPAPYVYVPYEQNPRSRMTLIVQSAGDAGALATPLREAVRSIDGNVPVFNLRTVATLYESRVTDTWLNYFQMVGTMGFIGLALATTGLYGLVAYTVSRRVKEFGIRVAVGATRRDVVWLVERRGLILAAVGIAIGGALTAVTAPMLLAGFPGLGASSPAGYALVALVLLTVSAIASYVPARRAAGLDPLRALRNE